MSVLADEHLADEPSEGRRHMPETSDTKGLARVLDALGLRGVRLFRFQSSALARRIITFNLIALCILLMGMLYLNQFKDGVVQEKQSSMVLESGLYAGLLENRMGPEASSGDLMFDLPVSEGVTARVFLADGTEAELVSGPVSEFQDGRRGITGWLTRIITLIPGIGGTSSPDAPENVAMLATEMAEAALSGQEVLRSATLTSGESILSTSHPVTIDGDIVGALVLTTQAGYLDGLRHSEQETVLRLFLLAVCVSIVLSIVLASTIANPIHDLAAAAEAGATKQGRNSEPERVRIPDLSGRPDEIGHLSLAMREMTSALYDRIDANEEFAADVAHEIKNPLASLRSAVETLRMVKKDEHRTKLLDVIEHDVRRLDRLVSDISNASRLDAELVKEEMEEFNLSQMLDRIVDFHGHEARDRGVELIWDEGEKPIFFDGLEARLAQVFVNLITNAISFCGEGDAVRVWAREKDERLLIVVEDTGPGIPQEALTKVFKRFYSEREEDNFGNNSGLGLSISKQIVEAHKGVIWAENIHAKDDEGGSEPLGARFVVGLPV